MTRRSALLGAAVLMLVPRAAVGRVKGGGPHDYAQRILAAQRAGRRLPRASSFEPGMSEERAYAFQHATVDAMLRGDRIAGIKAGSMTAAAQARLGGGPLFGVLLESGRVPAGVRLRMSDYRQLTVETEIGFELGRSVTKPLPDVETLRRYIAAVRPVVELPDNALEGDAPLTAIDAIAANVLARNFIAGPPSPPTGIDLDGLAIKLWLDGQRLYQAWGRDTYGDQWHALLWLVNNSVKRRGTLQRGSLIITGALGGARSAKVGHYKADFGVLGEITFSVS